MIKEKIIFATTILREIISLLLKIAGQAPIIASKVSFLDMKDLSSKDTPNPPFSKAFFLATIIRGKRPPFSI